MSRKRPVSIISDEDDDNQKLQPRPSRNVRQCHSVRVGRRNRHSQEDDDKSSSDGSDEGDHHDDAEDEDIDDGVNDLQELDDEGLASRLAFEVMFFLSQCLELIVVYVACPLVF